MLRAVGNCVQENLRLVWARLTLSKITIAYVVFTVTHCVIQTSLQAEAFVQNNHADYFLKDIVRAAHLPVPTGINILTKGGPLYLCQSSAIPQDCKMIWSSKPSNVSGSSNSPPFNLISTPTYPTGVFNNSVAIPPNATVHSMPEDLKSGDWHRRSLHTRIGRSLEVGTGQFDSNGTLISVPISGVPTRASLAPPSQSPATKTSSAPDSSTTPGVVNLSPTCVEVLAWPLQNLAASGRQDVVFLGFNVWVFGMSFVAVLNESMPHMITVVITHIMMTVWASFQLSMTDNFRSQFLRITRDGACDGVNLLPTYWEQRRKIEVAELVFNFLGLFVSIFLLWGLVKQFGWQTFKRVGANLTVNRMYKLVLGLSVVLQLSIFFIVSSMAVWIEQLVRGPAHTLEEHARIYQIMYLIILVLLVPWAACGWHGVRIENRDLTMVFLVGSLWVMTSWGGMFFSHVFRLLFASWGFFAMLSIVAIIMSGLNVVLGIACRLNFGKNSKVLARYLHQDEESVMEKRDYSKEFEYGEKFDFPGSGVPSYDSIARRAPPLTIPPEAHMNPNSRDHNHSPFSSRSSSPIRDENHSSHSRTSSMRSEYESSEAPRGSPTRSKKAWVIE